MGHVVMVVGEAYPNLDKMDSTTIKYVMHGISGHCI